jgi:hypothetical protein
MPEKKTVKVSVNHRVCLAWHDFGFCKGDWAEAALAAVRKYPQLITGILREKGCYVTAARNVIFQRFCKDEEYKDCTHIFMHDCDIWYPPDAIIQTSAAYEKGQPCDIMYGHYSLGDFASSFFGRNKKDVEKDVLGIPAPVDLTKMTTHQIYDIYAAGTGWLYASREALEKFYDAPWAKTDPWIWFGHDAHKLEEDRVLSSGKDPEAMKRRLLSPERILRLGEDLSFSVRANQLGLRIKGYTGLPLLHIKEQKQVCDFMTPLLDQVGVKLQRLDGNAEGGVAASSKKDYGGADGREGQTEPSGASQKSSWLGAGAKPVETEKSPPDEKP